MRTLRAAVRRPTVVLLVVGSDVVEGASAYRDPRATIWDIPHTVVVREDVPSRDWEEKLD